MCREVQGPLASIQLIMKVDRLDLKGPVGIGGIVLSKQHVVLWCCYRRVYFMVFGENLSYKFVNSPICCSSFAISSISSFSAGLAFVEYLYCMCLVSTVILRLMDGCPAGCKLANKSRTPRLISREVYQRGTAFKHMTAVVYMLRWARKVTSAEIGVAPEVGVSPGGGYVTGGRNINRGIIQKQIYL